jgi:hypothetical protein
MALATGVSTAAYAVMVRSMEPELLPNELRAAVWWCAAAARARFGRGRGDMERHTVVIRRQFDTGYGKNHLFDAARAYLTTWIDPRAKRRLYLVARPCQGAVPRDPGAALDSGRDAGRGVRDTAEERGRRRDAPGAQGIPSGEETEDKERSRVQEGRSRRLP